MLKRWKKKFWIMCYHRTSTEIIILLLVLLLIVHKYKDVSKAPHDFSVSPYAGATDLYDTPYERHSDRNGNTFPDQP